MVHLYHAVYKFVKGTIWPIKRVDERSYTSGFHDKVEWKLKFSCKAAIQRKVMVYESVSLWQMKTAKTDTKTPIL